MDTEIIITSIDDVILYLNDIVEYVDSLLYYWNGHEVYDMTEIMYSLLSISEIVETIKHYLYQKEMMDNEENAE